MKTTIEVHLKDFMVPNFALEDVPTADLGRSGRQFALADLSADTLEAMCETFTRQVFEKAGKRRPAAVTMARE